MSDRDQDREWLSNGASKYPEGWEAQMIASFGMEGALDLLAIQGGRVFDVDLRRRPFCGNDSLKDEIRDVQDAMSSLQRRAYQLWWDELEARRSSDLTA